MEKTKHCRVNKITLNSDEARNQTVPTQALIVLFDYISTKEVLLCSMVNHNWHYAAKSVLTSRRVTAVVGESCHKILHSNDVVKIAGTTAINSMDIRIPLEHTCYTWTGWPEAKTFCRQICTLPIRSLTLGANSCHFATKLMNCILFRVRETLEELRRIYTVRKGNSDAIGFLDFYGRQPPKVFPKLRVIAATTATGEFGVPWDDLTELIKAAPNLTKVNSLVDLEGIKYLATDKLKTLTKVICSSYEDLTGHFLNLVQAQPQLQYFDISDADRNKLVPPVWSTNMQKLLIQCQSSLQRLSICAEELLKYLKVATATPLSVLEHLELFISEKSFLQYFEHALAVIQESAAVLPAWKSLRVQFGEYCYHDIFDDIDFQSITQGNTNVFEVVLEDPPCVVSILEPCLRSFPNISSLAFQIIGCTHECDYADEAQYVHMDELAALLPRFSCLKRLKMGMRSLGWAPKDGSLDSLFCGVSYEECDQLKLNMETGGFSFQKWQYCPAQIPLLQLPALQELSLVFPPSYVFKDFPVTKISCGVAFTQNCNNVKVYVDWYGDSIAAELRRLKPCVEIRHITDGSDWW